MPAQQIAGEEGEHQIGLVTTTALVDDPDAIGVAVPRQAEVGAELQDLGLQVHHVLRILGVGQVVGEAPVRLAVQLDDIAADATKQLGTVAARHAVAGIDHHAESAGRPDQAHHDAEVVVADIARRHGALARLEVPPLDRVAQLLDLVLAQRGGAGVDHLHAVVVHRVVASGDVGAAVQTPVGGGEVQHRRGDLADVDDVEAGGAHPLHECGLELGRRLPVVPAHGDGATPPTANERGVSATDLPEDAGIDVGTDTAANVVGAKDVGIEHAGDLVRPA